jgi:glyoxylase-like metal-dependent hydrolase (beta-lactamase superfamily II)
VKYVFLTHTDSDHVGGLNLFKNANVSVAMDDLCQPPYYPEHVAMPNNELLEVNRSKISIHHAKPGYDYPAIRLLFTFSGLIWLSTRIYQTVHEGALAFLVVVSGAAT